MATAVTTTGFLVGELMPRLAVSAFTTHEGLIQLSATGLRIVVIFSHYRVSDGNVNFFKVSAWPVKPSSCH